MDAKTKLQEKRRLNSEFQNAKELTLSKWNNTLITVDEVVTHLLRSCEFCVSYRGTGHFIRFPRTEEHSCKQCPIYKKLGHTCFNDDHYKKLKLKVYSAKNSIADIINFLDKLVM